jgi:hypothetical protein
MALGCVVAMEREQILGLLREAEVNVAAGEARLLRHLRVVAKLDRVGEDSTLARETCGSIGCFTECTSPHETDF